MRPDPDEGHERHNGLRCLNLGLKSLQKRLEVAQRFEGKVVLLDLRPQAAEKIVDPSGELWIIPKQDLHTHGWCKQASLFKDPVKIEPDLCICPGASENFVD